MGEGERGRRGGERERESKFGILVWLSTRFAQDFFGKELIPRWSPKQMFFVLVTQSFLPYVTEKDSVTTVTSRLRRRLI